MSSNPEKRCYYEVLNLPKTCTGDEIRSAYKKLALQRHPDKLIQSGTPPSDATASFQELVHAYEVLSDPKERSWYDSHRSQILFTSPTQSTHNSATTPFPDLFPYFSPSCYTDYSDPKTGFYAVYGGIFDRILGCEVNYCRRMGLGVGVVKVAPVMGEVGSDYGQVSAFYGYWLGFSTVMDFGWVDVYDAAAGEDRRSRRRMEEENKKVRRKAKREFNETVRGLAEFVRKRDKRVVDMMVRKERERERKREEEVRRRKEKERERLERVRAYKEPEWARVEEEEVGEGDEEEGEDEEEKKEFYCVACGKKFKSDKQWKNHEQSKKHKEKVAELRRSFVVEDQEFEELDQEVEEGGEGSDRELDGDEGEVEVGEGEEGADDGFVSAEEEEGEDVDGLEERFKENVVLEEGKDGEEVKSNVEDGVGNAEEQNGVHRSEGESDEEFSVLEPMHSGRRRGRRGVLKNPFVEKDNAKSEDEMEYNNKKGKKKSRRAKKDKGKVVEAETTSAGGGEANVQREEANGGDGSDGADDDREIYETQSSTKAGKKGVERKGTSKRDTETKPKNSSKGKKQKEKSTNPEPVCEKCGEEFESRNQLYKHLSETGHASLKFK